MRWFWHNKRDHEVAEAERDLKQARIERERAEMKSREVRSHWEIVHEVVTESRTIRKVNHLAEDLIVIFRGHP